jgi:glycosidase
MNHQKVVVYQVFTRLFGNTNTNNRPWGSLEENGVGKFSDFTAEALSSIADLGTTHIWFTGVPHHAIVGDYTHIGIENDDPEVVKGRAGSPYAVKDYYSVNPDLADDPSARMEEFEALVERSHRVGLKVIIDIVPNHVARRYHSIAKPDGVRDFGEDDDPTLDYHKHNNYYYIPGSSFRLPDPLDGYRPLGGEAHPLIDGKFEETPAKWTGNGSQLAKPHFHDWYETVKVNYGVRPDGQRDFPELPQSLRRSDPEQMLTFWKQHDLPNSWLKFKDIALYWLDKGVDGFRYDMAGMVPVEFWNYLNASIKHHRPEAFVMAEIYERELYHDFIEIGLMDALYDKVDFYDTLKGIVREERHASDLIHDIERLHPIEKHLLRFLENHDEQRLPCDDFAGEARVGMPAMTVSALVGSGPVLLYSGQEFGEAALEKTGFGDPTRSTIFDYWGFEWTARWKGKGDYSGQGLRSEERQLREFYQKLLVFTRDAHALKGHFYDLHRYNLQHSQNYYERVYTFARFNKQHRLLCAVNYSRRERFRFRWLIPTDLLEKWQLKKEPTSLKDVLGQQEYTLEFENDTAHIELCLAPLQSLILPLEEH